MGYPPQSCEASPAIYRNTPDTGELTCNNPH